MRPRPIRRIKNDELLSASTVGDLKGFVDKLAVPMGWLEAPSYASLLELVRHPLTRLYLFVIISLPLVHGAHRLRYVLYDGLKLKHLTALIVAVCYGTAVVGSVAAAYFLLNLP